MQLTRNYYKEQKDAIRKNEYFKYKYLMRKNIFNVANEHSIIKSRNMEMIQDQMSRLLKDQMTKIKTQILYDNSFR